MLPLDISSAPSDQAWLDGPFGALSESDFHLLGSFSSPSPPLFSTNPPTSGQDPPGNPAHSCREPSPDTPSRQTPRPPRPRIHPCDHPGCGYISAWRKDVKTHKLTHSDSMPYSCPNPGCNKAFRRQDHANRHAKRACKYYGPQTPQTPLR